jgi:hypothetical protein
MAFDDNSGSDFIVLLFFVLIAAVLATRILAWNYVKGLLASGWSMAQGHVELGGVEERHVRYITYYVARLDYSYSVNNEYYSGVLRTGISAGEVGRSFHQYHEGPNDLHPIPSKPSGKVGTSPA